MSSIKISLYQLTFGQLYWFVDAARASGVHPSNPVTYDWYDDDYDPQIAGLTTHVNPNIYTRSITPLTLQQNQDLAMVLEKIITAGGDAREQLPALRYWKDILQGVPPRPSHPASASQ